MAEIQALLNLQEIDTKYMMLENTLKKSPTQEKITELLDRLPILRNKLDKKNAKLTQIYKTQRHEEWHIKDITETINSISKRLYSGSITNPREIENTRCRLNSLKSNKNKLEDDVIALMEKAENLELEISKINLKVEQMEEKMKRLTCERDVEIKEISEKLTEMRKVRENIRSDISHSTVKKYEQLLKDRGSPVVVPIVGRLCGGCHVAIPSSLIILAKPNNKIVRCENCGRLLCWQE